MSTELALMAPAPKDPTAAERQRRYRRRNARRNGRDVATVTRDAVERDGVTLLCDRQDKTEASFNDDGDLVLTQSSWPDDDSIIIISHDNIDAFIDRLTDAVGIPSFGGPG